MNPVPLLIISLLLAFFLGSENANSVSPLKSGSPCPKLGIQKVQLSKQFICVKYSNRLIWKKLPKKNGNQVNDNPSKPSAEEPIKKPIPRDYNGNPCFPYETSIAKLKENNQDETVRKPFGDSWYWVYLKNLNEPIQFQVSGLLRFKMECRLWMLWYAPIPWSVHIDNPKVSVLIKTPQTCELLGTNGATSTSDVVIRITPRESGLCQVDVVLEGQTDYYLGTIEEFNFLISD